MRYRYFRRLGKVGWALAAILFSTTVAESAPVSWGVNGVGGSGNWNSSTANWFNGSQNVTWPSGGDAVFGGASGGTVNTASGLIVNSMTFNQPGYVIQGATIRAAATGLTVTTNFDATINSSLSSSDFVNGNFLVKNGPAVLQIGDTSFLDAIRVNQGEVRFTDSFVFSDVTLANQPGVAITLAPSGNFAMIDSLSGGGISGGMVRPNDQARTVTFTTRGENFGGVLADNGAGILALELLSSLNSPLTFTNNNTHSGATRSFGPLVLSGNGAIPNSPLSISNSLLLDNSGTANTNRLSDTNTVTLRGTIKLQGNLTTPVNEVLGPLSFSGASRVNVVQPGSAATQLTFASLQRNGAATLDVTGPGVFLGLSNGSTGIVPPYVTAGNEWAVVGGNNDIVPLANYAININAGSTADHVKLTAYAATLADDTARASLNLQNGAVQPQGLDLGGKNLSLTTGGILSSGAGPSTIHGGNLSTPAQEWVVTATNNLTIGANIFNSPAGVSLTKAGPGTLTLSGMNTYTGPTAIVQGALVAYSDANLGAGATIDLQGGALQAGANFTSTKTFTGTTGGIDTAGHDVAFAGTNVGRLFKFGQGTLTLPDLNADVDSLTAVSQGVLKLTNATAGYVSLQGGTLEAAGSLSSVFASGGPIILDIGGGQAATLIIDSYGGPQGFTLINFGLGSTSSDFLTIHDPLLSSFGEVFRFEFHNLGGVTTGVDYPLMSIGQNVFLFSSSAFGFAPDMAAKGWSGTFKTTGDLVSVNFLTVPEPAETALMLLQGALLALAARWHMRRRRCTA